jgi:UDP-N-acetylglucosamine--N-acetylmuramyl-(pentapeptide) pyrophosphoryl-undecaprenol N-acetylglucosamine transferase
MTEPVAPTVAPAPAVAARPARQALLAGGGSGGHVFPALAVRDELARRGWSVRLAGSPEGMEARLAAARGVELVALPARPFVGKSIFAKLSALGTLVRSAIVARRIVRNDGVDLVVGTGGYVSAPAVLGGRWAGRPTAIVEPNAEPGAANRWLSRIADGAAVAYESSGARLACAVWVTGVPVRDGFFDAPPLRAEGKPRMLVLGGSQGSQRLNRILPEVLRRLFETRPEISVMHQCGERHLETTLAAYQAAGVASERLRVVPFVDNMPATMAAVDLVVSRAGAITLAEICAAGRPALLLPLPLAGGHQVENARRIEEAGAARFVEDHVLDGDRLTRELEDLLGDRARLADMGERARALARPGAAAAIADRLEELVASRRVAALPGAGSLAA